MSAVYCATLSRFGRGVPWCPSEDTDDHGESIPMTAHFQIKASVARPSSATPGPTLADVIALAMADQDLAPHHKRDVISALRSICRHGRLDPALTPASHDYFRKFFANAH